jgi:small subunit ribosomal protein S11e
MEHQTEKAFQKQATVVYNNKKGTSKKARYVRPVGLGYKIPREAREGTYIDKKCPFTGDVRIR